MSGPPAAGVPVDLGASGPPTALLVQYRPPGISGARIVGAIGLMVVYFGLVGLLPYYLEQYASRYGVSSPVEPTFLLLAGAGVAILAGLSVATKPTRAWGPVRVLAAGFDIVYLLYLLQNPVFSTTIRGFMITLTYARILELFLIPPAIGLLAGVVTSLADIRHPWERIQLQFPTTGSPRPNESYGQPI